VTRGWTETGATWNTYDGTNPWATPGGDYNATPEWTTTVGTVSSGSAVYWHPTELVRKWYTGQVPNYGFLIKSQNETTNTVTYYHSRNASSQGNWPILEVVYTPWLGVQDFWTYETMDLGGDLSQQVNVCNGNLILQKDDLAIPGVELDNVVGRVYNGLSPWTYDLGKKWKLTAGPDVYLYVNADGSVRWTDFTGTEVAFAKNPDGSFSSPPGIHYTLEYTGGVYKLKDRRGVTYTFQYVGSGLPRLSSAVTDRNNNTLTYSYTNDRLTSITDTVGRTVTVSYNASGYIASLTDNANRTTQYSYDANGRLTSVTDPANQVASYSYDANGRLASVTDPRNNTTQYSYDSRGRLTSVTDALNNVTSFTYNSGSTVVTDANNHSTTYTCDVYGRVTSVQDARGNTTQYQYDSDHNVTQVTDPAGKITTLTYDSLFRLDTVTDPLGLTESDDYTDSYNLYYPTTLTDPRSKATNYSYSTTGNLTSVDAPALPPASFTHNANGTVASMTDPKGYTTNHAYDVDGNLTQITDPLSRVTTMAYDSVSRRTSLTDAKNQTTTYQYDAVDRLTQVTYHDGSTVSFSYDGNGNVTQMVDPTGTTTYQYDARNRLTQKTLPDGTVITFTYDAVGNLTSMADPGGTVSYAYNAVNLVNTVTEPGGHMTSFTYDSRNRVTQIAYPNGVTVYKDWDDGGKLTRIRAVKGGLTLTDFTYAYVDPATGQATHLRYSVTDKGGNVTRYTYDDAGRLTSAVTKDSGGTITDNRSWVLDANSNWSSRTANGASVSYLYDQANQLIYNSGNGFAYSWDNNGNLTADPSRTYTYNTADQTVNISGVTMSYAGLGQMERVTRGSDSYRYNALGIGPGLEQDGGGVFTYYTRTPDGGLLGFRRSGTRYYYVVDGLGSVVAVTNSSGSVVNSYHYDPYGITLSSSEQVAQPYQFAGAYYDTATGLYKLGARYYDPYIGRFTQRDPFPASAYDPLSYNRYVYVADNPVNYVDATGRQYIDVNGTAAFPFGWTFGVQFDLRGGWIHPYFGFAGGSPGVSITFSPQQVSPGYYVGANGYYALGGGIGRSVTGSWRTFNGYRRNYYWEAGVGTPGASASAYRVFRPLRWRLRLPWQ
jgi:RHS repeat-associated protein